MSQLPTGTREEVAARYHPYLPPDIAEKEFVLVMQVSDTALRDRLLENFMSEAQNSTDIALRSLARTQLPESQKQHLASLIPKRENEADPAPNDEE